MRILKLVIGLTVLLSGVSAVVPSAAAEAARAADRERLYLWWSPDRADNFTSGSEQGNQDARDAGYDLARIDGYGLTKARGSGTKPLHLFWNAERGDNFTTATQTGIDAAAAAGYSYVRVEGYVYPA